MKAYREKSHNHLTTCTSMSYTIQCTFTTLKKELHKTENKTSLALQREAIKTPIANIIHGNESLNLPPKI